MINRCKGTISTVLSNKQLVVLLFLSLCFNQLWAAKVYQPEFADPIKTNLTWTPFPELTGKGVQTMAQDNSGVFWFGTDQGIYRYNGIEWQEFSQKHGLPNGIIRNFVFPKDGQVSVLYKNDGFYTFNNMYWDHFDFGFNDRNEIHYNKALSINSDTLWMTCELGAILHTKTHSILYTLYGTFDLSSPIHNVTHQTFFMDFYDVYQDIYGNLFFIVLQKTRADLVYIPDWRNNLNHRDKWYSYPIQQQGNATSLRPRIIQASDGEYWIYTYNEEYGLVHFSHPSSRWIFIDLGELGGTNVVLSASETDDGNLWFGGNGFLYVYRDGQFIVYTPEEIRLPFSGIHLLQARDGAIWLACLNSHVYRIDYSRKRWQIINDLNFQLETSSGEQYFIEKDRRIIKHKTDGSWISLDQTDGLIDIPLTIIEAKDGDLWVAGSHKGVAAASFYDGQQWERITFPDLSWSIAYTAALAADDGRIWFGSMSDPTGPFKGGCVVLTPGENGYSIEHIVSERESFNRICSLAQDTSGRIWAAATHLLYFENNMWNLIQEPEDLQYGWLDHILAASDGSLWIAKGGVGVYRIYANTWEKYSTEQGLPSNMVSNLLEINGDIIAATDMGLSRFDGKSWSPFITVDKISILRESGELKGNAHKHLWINKTPRDWYFRALKTEKTINIREFLTINYQSENQPPTTRLITFQQKLNKPANQYIVWRGNDPMESTSSVDLTYSYRIGENPWSPFTTENSLQMLNMQEGQYRFQVRARDADGNIDPSPAIAEFRVLPPIWKQGWMILLMSFFGSVILGLMISITYKNRKLIEAKSKIEEAAAFKERFFENISHEFRTPLTMILGVISNWTKIKIREDEEIKQIKIVQRHSLYLLRLVNQLLEFRHLESESKRLQVSQGDLGHFIRQLLDLFAPLAKEHNIQLKFNSVVENKVWFDHEKVETVLMNLLSNSLKYTQDYGRVTVSINYTNIVAQNKKNNSKHKVDTNATDNLWVEVKVADTGIGITPERMEHIFDRFYSVDHPGKLYYDSIGVGLDLTKELVEHHHGKIDVESVVGSGTTFTICFPVNRASYNQKEISTDLQTRRNMNLTPEQIEEIRHEREQLDPHVFNHLTEQGMERKTLILIVEDHPDMRDLLQDWLKNSYDVMTAVNGREALLIALANVPDLILTDVMMPELDGLELTRQLKTNKITCHIPVVLLTIKNEIEHRVEGIEAGADAYLGKPFVQEELAAVISNLIKNRQELRERFSRELVVKPKDIVVTELDEDFLEHCIKIVEENISDPDFHVDEFCRDIGMSRTQAYLKLQSISGFSLNEFIIHIRLKRAAQLLLESNLNISEIAYDLGFCDHAHLTRHFKRAFGCPPKEYRNNTRVNI